jgi:hypothetical protein
MAKPSSSKMRFHKDRYWNGVLSGFFLGCVFISAALLSFIQYQGLRFVINPEQLSSLVQAKVQLEARQNIPQILEKIKEDLPAELPNHLDEIDELTIGIGNSQVKLPPDFQAALKTELSRIFEAALINTLSNYDTQAFEKLIGDDAYKMVQKTIRQELIGKTYRIKYSGLFSVPVKFVAGNSMLYSKMD